MKKKYPKLLLLCLMFYLGMVNTQAQNVNIPDASFKAYLVGNSSINTNSDGEIQETEAAAFTGTIEVTGSIDVLDFTGLEKFVELTSFIYRSTNGNVAQNIDLSQLVKLENIQFEASNPFPIQSLKLPENNTFAFDADLSLFNIGSVTVNNTQMRSYAGVVSSTYIDFSDTIGLQEVTLLSLNSELENINLANGNTSAITDLFTNATTCIQIDPGFTPPTDGSWDNQGNATYNTTPCQTTLETNEVNKSEVGLYPNPAKNILTIKLNNTITAKHIQIVDLRGKLLLESSVTDNLLHIDVSQLKTGIYFLRIGDITEKLIIE